MKKQAFILTILITLIAGISFAQEGNLILDFSGKDASTGASIDLQSVHVKNLTQNCDTTVYGAAPSLYLEWLGINDQFALHNFSLSNCSPNPFTGRTNFTVSTNDKQSIFIQLINMQGVIIAEFNNDLIKGVHSFEIFGIKTGFYNLIVSSGKYVKSQKIICNSQDKNAAIKINYVGLTNNNPDLKSTKEIDGFGFQPGDQLEITATAIGYLDEIIIVSPTESFAYTFEMEAATPVDVKLYVNMSYQIQQGNFDPSNSNLDVAGTFNDWEGTPITYIIDGNIYKVVIQDLAVGSVIDFKFRRNGAWDGTEEFPDGGADRTYTVQESGNYLHYWYNDESIPCAGSLIDNRDGQEYNIVAIGTQCWMAENLNYYDINSWCYDNESSNCETYGSLYNAAIASSMCPDGWHLPSLGEVDAMADYLGGEDVAGGKMKETGTAHWVSPNTGATNSSGFNALPGGWAGSNGWDFEDLGLIGAYQTSTQNYPNFGQYNLQHDSQQLHIGWGGQVARSIRCVRD